MVSLLKVGSAVQGSLSPRAHSLHRATALATSSLLALSAGLASADDRTEIGSPTSYPWNTVSALDIGESSRGSAVVVTPYTALTAGHCVYNRTEGHYHTVTHEVHPGQYEVSGTIYRPYGSRMAEYLHTNSKYAGGTYSPVADVDYGALQWTCPFEDLSTFMPVVFDYDAYYINMSGYPVEDLNYSAPNDQWWDADPVTTLTSRQLVYEARSTGGASGAPVWAYNEADGRRIVGINRGHSSSTNGLGPRMVWQNEDLIESWMDWEPTELELLSHLCSLPVILPFSGLVDFYKANPSKLLSAQTLKVVSPPQVKGTVPDRVVMQVIENQFYKWEEYLTNASAQDGSKYLRMKKPEDRWLSVYDARVLLTASKQWSQQLPSGEYGTSVPAPSVPKNPIMPQETSQQGSPSNDTSVDTLAGQD